MIGIIRPDTFVIGQHPHVSQSRSFVEKVIGARELIYLVGRCTGFADRIGTNSNGHHLRVPSAHSHLFAFRSFTCRLVFENLEQKRVTCQKLKEQKCSKECEI